jgi:hypothetical protein
MPSWHDDDDADAGDSFVTIIRSIRPSGGLLLSRTRMLPRHRLIAMGASGIFRDLTLRIVASREPLLWRRLSSFQ